MLTSRIIFTTLFSIFILGSVWIIYGNFHEDKVGDVDEKTNGVKNANSISNSSLALIYPPPSNSKESPAGDLRIVTEEELDILREEQNTWKRSRGYFDKQDYLSYDGYSFETLEKLGADGDLLALHVVGKKYRRAREYDNEHSAFFKAAIQGSTNALLELAVAHRFNREAYLKQGDVEAAHLEMMKEMAIYEVAAKRGDGSGVSLGLLRLARENVLLTNEQIDEISKGASTYLKILERERFSTIGEPFDNSTSLLEVEFQNHLHSAATNNSLWASKFLDR